MATTAPIPSNNLEHEKPHTDSASDGKPESLLNNDVEKQNDQDTEQDESQRSVAPAATSAPPPSGPPGGPVPNGGTKAWLQVLCSWMLFFNTW